MIDIKPFVAEQLKDIAAVELSYNDNFVTLPVIVMTETENESVAVIENRERISRVTIQLDIYAETAAEAEAKAVKASNILTAKGLRRVFGESIYDDDKPRKCMRFTCGIDEVSGRILAI